ncbi:MAG TPA: right-handed parallel beta-helix repeat-containing protein [Candidatus Binatia bacterium]|nr:right-handed parallel beta-helix repeat-containing protein [Candidatus Binatia bacterium]
MNYFNPYPLCVDNTVITAWKFQITEAAKTPWLAELLAWHGGELFPRFVATYSELRALPRGARRALQRRLAHSRELSAVLQEWLQQQSSRALQQKLAATLAGAALLLVLGRGVAEANTITVNATVPGVVADGKCSLIEAIINANDTVTGGPLSDCAAGDPLGEDHIILPKKTFTLTTPYDTYYGDPTGLPLITSAITIEGNGAKITRKKSSPNFRLMAVGPTGDLDLENLTLSGGSSSSHNGGGAIFNYGETTISNSTITGNTAYYGGAVSNSGSLTVQNSTISKNTANGPYNPVTLQGSGGGIVNFGTSTVSNSTITGNKAYVGGGLSNSGSISIDGSTISKNVLKGRLANGQLYGGYGAGIANDNTGTLNVSNSVISGNNALIGGAIVNAGEFSISDSEISKNIATAGAGIANNGGSAPTQTIVNSTISGNIAKLKTFRAGAVIYFVGGVGGALLNYRSTVTLTNSTISGNKATGKKFRGYLLGGAGGGIANADTAAANLTLTGGSVTGNSATFFGGGLFNDHGVYSTSASVTGNNAKYGPDIFSLP